MINFNDIFIETYIDYKKKYTKAAHATNVNYSAEKICNSLYKFVNNSCYFNLFSDPIKGKYLNEIHMCLVNRSFYDKLYNKIVNKYLKITNYETLETLAYDSAFVRNINGKELNGRNPHYYNKPGFKLNVLVDKLRTPVGISFMDSTNNDSLSVNEMFNYLHVSKEILKTHTKTILFDSGYEGLINNYNLTEEGYNIYMGYNKRNNKKNIEDKLATNNEIKKYKERGIVENFIGNIQRTPVLINNYQKTIKSYRGLLLMKTSMMLCKKINRIVAEQNNEKLRLDREEENKKKKENREKIIRKKRKDKENKKIEDAQLAEKRKQNIEKIKNEITLRIFKKVTNVDKIIKDCHKIYLLHKVLNRKTLQINKYNENMNDITNAKLFEDLKIENSLETLDRIINNNIEKQNTNNDDYNKFEKIIKRNLSDDILNNYIYNIKSYTFAKKNLYILQLNKYAFTENNINKLIKDYDWNNKIKIIFENMLSEINERTPVTNNELFSFIFQKNKLEVSKQKCETKDNLDII